MNSVKQIAGQESDYSEKNRLKGVTSADLGFTRKNSIFVNESITPKFKELYSSVNKFKNDSNFRFVWSRNGKFTLGKMLILHRKSTLLRL